MIARYLYYWSIVFFCQASWLYILKWLKLINRIYFHVGKLDEEQYQFREKSVFFVYLVFAVTLAILNVATITRELIREIKDGTSVIFIFATSDISILLISTYAVSFLLTLAVGSFLVSKLRQFYKSNYYENSRTIAQATALQCAGLSFMLLT